MRSPRLALVFRLNRAAHCERASEAEARARLLSTGKRRIALAAAESAGFGPFWAAIRAMVLLWADSEARGIGCAVPANCAFSVFSGAARALLAASDGISSIRTELLNLALSAGPLPL